MATILLTGDVMIGRGIDQILPNSVDPILYERFMTSARGYVRLAESRSGPIPRNVAFNYLWGNALEPMRRADLAIINLETALTRSRTPAPGKGIHYRCHPANIPSLTAAGVDCCALGNNHVLDWGEEGLIETLATLDKAGVRHCGAGRDRQQAEAPAVLALGDGRRVLVYSLGSPSSGVPQSWAATSRRPGVSLLDDYRAAFERLSVQVRSSKKAGDIAIVSIHWGSNWGYEIPDGDQRLARLLIDHAAVDIVHGHSSHHRKAVEFHRGKPILYGCGDFLNDYEGIEGQDEFRSDLVLAFQLSLGKAWSLDMLPFAIKKFRLHHADRRQAEWLRETMDRECRIFGGRVLMDRQPGLKDRFSLKLIAA